MSNQVHTNRISIDDLKRRFADRIARARSQFKQTPKSELAWLLVGMAWLVAAFAYLFLEVRDWTILIVVLVVMTVTLYAVERVDRATVSLESLVPRWDTSLVREALRTVTTSYESYAHSVVLCNHVLECIASRRLKYEPVVAIIGSIAYIFGLSYYIRTYHPQPPDLIGAYLTSFGFALFLIALLLVFAFLRTFSQSYAMWQIRRSNAKLERSLRSVLECVKSQESDSDSLDHLTHFHLKTELDSLLKNIGRIDKLLARPGVITLRRIDIIVTIAASLAPATLSIVGSVLGVEWSSFFPVSLTVFLSIFALFLLSIMTVSYSGRVMEWAGTTQAITMLDRAVERLVVACLGKEWKLILSEYFFVSTEPDSIQDEMAIDEESDVTG